MNKKVNSILFILGATLFNVLIAIASFLLLFVFYANNIMMQLGETARGWGLIIIFIASIVISFIVYRVVLKFLLKKIDVDKYFDPLFVNQNMRKKGS